MMELRDVLGVVRKRWVIAVIGLILAMGFAYAAYKSRSDDQYTSTATLFVTQKGFPYANPTGAGTGVNPAQLSTLAFLYAQLAESNSIRQSIGAPPASIDAAVATSGAFGSGTPLPFIDLTGKAKTAADAQLLANKDTAALQRYMLAGQEAANTPVDQRVEIRVITAAPLGKPVAARTRAVVLPGVVFMTVILVTLGLIFLLENMTKPSEARIEPRPVEEFAAGAHPIQGAVAHSPTERIDQRTGRGGLLRRT